MEMVLRSGMWVVVLRILFSFGMKDDEKKVIEEVEKYVKCYYNESDMLIMMVVLYSLYICSIELLEECVWIVVEN